MMYFFLGWLVCITIVVALQSVKSPTKPTGMTEMWNPPSQQKLNEDLTSFFKKQDKEMAEFIKAPRAAELIKGKKDLTLDDLIV